MRFSKCVNLLEMDVNVIWSKLFRIKLAKEKNLNYNNNYINI